MTDDPLTRAVGEITSAVGERLARLYRSNIKHSNYQPVPELLRPWLPDPEIDPQWRDPRPRLPLIRAALHQDPAGPAVVELGANTGYNTLTLAAELPARRFVAVEASRPHAEFVAECAELLELRNVTVVAEGMLPEQLSQRWPGSVILDFNVAHHLGTDIAVDAVTDVPSWWAVGLPRWLATAAAHPSYWFSVGYRMGGSRAHDLHDPDDPDGMLRRVREAAPPGLVLADVWAAVGDGRGGVRYERHDPGVPSLNSVAAHETELGSYRGEYFRRPILRFVGS